MEDGGVSTLSADISSIMAAIDAGDIGLTESLVNEFTQTHTNEEAFRDLSRALSNADGSLSNAHTQDRERSRAASAKQAAANRAFYMMQQAQTFANQQKADFAKMQGALGAMRILLDDMDMRLAQINQRITELGLEPGAEAFWRERLCLEQIEDDIEGCHQKIDELEQELLTSQALLDDVLAKAPPELLDRLNAVHTAGNQIIALPIPEDFIREQIPGYEPAAEGIWQPLYQDANGEDFYMMIDGQRVDVPKDYIENNEDLFAGGKTLQEHLDNQIARGESFADQLDEDYIQQFRDDYDAYLEYCEENGLMDVRGALLGGLKKKEALEQGIQNVRDQIDKLETRIENIEEYLSKPNAELRKEMEDIYNLHVELTQALDDKRHAAIEAQTEYVTTLNSAYARIQESIALGQQKNDDNLEGGLITQAEHEAFKQRWDRFSAESERLKTDIENTETTRNAINDSLPEHIKALGEELGMGSRFIETAEIVMEVEKEVVVLSLDIPQDTAEQGRYIVYTDEQGQPFVYIATGEQGVMNQANVPHYLDEEHIAKINEQREAGKSFGQDADPSQVSFHRTQFKYLRIEFERKGYGDEFYELQDKLEELDTAEARLKDLKQQWDQLELDVQALHDEQNTLTAERLAERESALADRRKELETDIYAQTSTIDRLSEELTIAERDLGEMHQTNSYIDTAAEHFADRHQLLRDTYTGSPEKFAAYHAAKEDPIRINGEIAYYDTETFQIYHLTEEGGVLSRAYIENDPLAYQEFMDQWIQGRLAGNECESDKVPVDPTNTPDDTAGAILSMQSADNAHQENAIDQQEERIEDIEKEIDKEHQNAFKEAATGANAEKTVRPANQFGENGRSMGPPPGPPPPSAPVPGHSLEDRTAEAGV